MRSRFKGSLVITVALAVLAQAPSALAQVPRPTGYLERGNLEYAEQGPVFVPDSESGGRFGRYFRLGGYDHLITYGLGQSSTFDVLWPSYHLKDHIQDLLRVSPGGLDRMVRYHEAQSYPEGFARIGTILLWGAVLTAIGGLAYDKWPGNPREMQPGFWYATGGVATLGLATWGGSTWAAHDNQALLDQAIAAYNRDMAGKRRIGPPSSRPLE